MAWEILADGKIHFMGSCFHVATLVFLLLCQHALGQFVHFASPPPGIAFVKIQTSPKFLKIQIAGTLQPATLNLNGRQVALKSYPQGVERFVTGPAALWVDGVKVEGRGSVGSFFVTPSFEDIGKGKIEFVLRDSRGEYRRAEIRLNSTFLDAPLVVESQIEEDRPSDRYRFRLSGILSPELSLVIEGADHWSREEGRVSFEVSVPVGASYLYGQVKEGERVLRSLTLPIQVSHQGPDAQSFYFSVKGLESSGEGHSWVVDAKGSELEGSIHPQALLTVAGERVEVARDGTFKVRIYPEESEFDLELETEFRGEELKKSVTVNCGNCEWSWRSPRHRRKWNPYFEIHMFGYARVDEYTPERFNPQPGLGAGVYLGSNWALQLGIKEVDGLGDHVEGTVESSFSRGLFVAAGASYVYRENFLFGAGLGYLGGLYREFNRGPNGGQGVAETRYSVGVYLSAEARIALSRTWECVPRLVAMPPLLQFIRRNQPFTYLAFDLFRIRYHF